MKVECQVVTTPSSDTAGTLILLHLDARRYLLGHVGEGAQRALLHRRIRTSRINDFLLSGRTDWKTCGGLLGMILTLADQEAAKQADYETKRKEALRRQQEMPAGTYKLGATPAVPEPLDKKALNVHGGDNLMHKLGTTRAFIFRTNMQINVNEVKNDFADEYLHVHPMKIYPGDYDAIAQGSGATTTPDGDLTAFSLDGSARKRSFDEFRAPRNRTEILASVVSDMFNSSWTMDTMIDEPVDAEPSKDGPSSPYSPPSSPTKRMAPSHETTTPTEPQATRKVRAPWPAAAVKQLPRSKPSPASISYYISLHPQRGRFLPNKAKELGVAPGPEFRKLTEGKSVTTTGGRVVTPEECMEPPKPGKKILVLDLPEKSYIAPALARPELQEDFEATVFWILGEEVATDERLYEKMKDWPAANHIVSSPDTCPNDITFQGAAKACTRLNMLHPDHFPLPYYHSTPRITLPEETKAIIAKPQQVFQIAPSFEATALPIEMVKDGAFDFEGVRADIEPEYLKLCQLAKEEINAEEEKAKAGGKSGYVLPGKDVEIITLGTGSAQPSKYRNVSATLMRVPNVGSILFDCGEDTIGQLSRLYPPSELQEVLNDLKCIYISHMHADHHLGTAAVLKAWYKAKHNCVPLPTTEDRSSDISMPDIDTIPTAPTTTTDDGTMYIVALGKYSTWLQEYADVEDFGLSRIRLISTEDIRLQSGPTLAHLPALLHTLSLSRIQIAKAYHCLGATTTAFTFSNPPGFKFAYSGDTRPTPQFTTIGRDATVLLHEATFDDELAAEAVAKRHSTTAEALQAGVAMRAKRVILTHFSQRYPKLPVLGNGGDGNGMGEMKVAVAFDMMRMKVGEIGRFERMIPALVELYKEEEKEGEKEGEKEEEEEVGDAAASTGVKAEAKAMKPRHAQEKKGGGGSNNEKKEQRRAARASKAQGGQGQGAGRRGGGGGKPEQVPREPQVSGVILPVSEATTKANMPPVGVEDVGDRAVEAVADGSGAI